MALLAASSGVFAHLAIFRSGERDVAFPSIFVVYLQLAPLGYGSALPHCP